MTDDRIDRYIETRHADMTGVRIEDLKRETGLPEPIIERELEERGFNRPFHKGNKWQPGYRRLR